MWTTSGRDATRITSRAGATWTISGSRSGAGHDVSVHDLGDGVTAPRADAGTTPDATAETPDRNGAYPRLTEGQLETLSTLGERRATTERARCCSARASGDYDFYVVLAGPSPSTGRRRRTSGWSPCMARGRFLGELSLLTGQAPSSRRSSRSRARCWSSPWSGCASSCRTTRRSATSSCARTCCGARCLIGLGGGLRIVGSRFSPDTRRLREFAARNRLPHRWIDVEDDPAAEALLRQLGIAPEDTPVVIWAATSVLRNPSNADLARVVGLPAAPPRTDGLDLVVVGAGPGRPRSGGLRRLRGARRPRRSTRSPPAARRATSSRIENYLGFPAGISGAELAERASCRRRSSARASASRREAVGLEPRDGHYLVRLDDGELVTARTRGRRHRRALPQADGRRARALRGHERLLRGDRDGGAGLPGRPGGGRRRRQLRRARPRLFLVAHAARGARWSCASETSARHVALPGRPDRAHAEHRGAAAHRGPRAPRRRRLEARRRRGRRRGERRGSMPGRCSSSSAPSRTPRGCGDVVALDARATSSPAPDVAPTTAAVRPRRQRRPRSRRAGPASSPPGDVRQRVDEARRLGRRRGSRCPVRLVHEHLADRHSLERPEDARGG